MGKAYQDPDQPDSSREIDVHGFRVFLGDDENRRYVNARLIIECKQTTNPYVFVGRNPEPHERWRTPTEHQLVHEYVSERVELGGNRFSSRQHPAWKFAGLHELPGSSSREDFLADQMTKLTRRKAWEATNEGIFTGLIYPLAKAVRAHQTPRRRGSAGFDLANDPISLQFLFPIVVTNATLYAINATKDPLQPEERRWVRMTRELKTSKLDGRFSADVVQFGALAEYLEARVIGFCHAVAADLSDDPAKYATATLPPSP